MYRSSISVGVATGFINARVHERAFMCFVVMSCVRYFPLVPCAFSCNGQTPAGESDNPTRLVAHLLTDGDMCGWPLG